MSTPIAYFVFNRPEITATTFEAIRQQRPRQLFIIADGPRPGMPSDVQRCADVRAVVSQVDWPCEVHHNWADTNMGCGSRVSSGIDWVFESVEMAIILEDDCLPHPDFFRFCDELLERYANDDRVIAISGDNFQNGAVRGDGSYYFSKYSHIWGWATWRRAWEHFDADLGFWPEWSQTNAWLDLCPDPVERTYWKGIAERMRNNEIDSWAYPWILCAFHQNGLTATPNANLVTNIGFGPDATHTTSRNPQHAVGLSALGEIVPPSEKAGDISADAYDFDHRFGGDAIRNPWKPRYLVRRILGGGRRRLKRALQRGRT